MAKSRAWAITDFVADINVWNALEGTAYRVAGREICPTTGRVHFQGYVRFTNPRTLRGVRDLFPGRHVEAARGNDQANRAYCTKDGAVVIEDGQLGVPGARNDIKDVADLVRGGDSVDSLMVAGGHDGPLAKYTKYYDRLEGLLSPGRNWVTEVIILWGAAGTGKTRAAFDRGATPVVYDGKFYDYRGQETVLFDEFDPNTMRREEFLRITDRYPCRVPIKGGFINWAPRTIIFTTNFDPSRWYGGDPAFRRRVVIRHIVEDEDPEQR